MRAARRALLGTSAALASVAAAGVDPARADALGELETEIEEIEAEARDIERSLEHSEEVRGLHHADEREQRLVDARVAFAAGGYERTALILYDVVEEHPGEPGHDTALFYLAESLFRKGDFVAAQTYFTNLVEERGAESGYYERALRRLVEISLEIDRPEAAEPHLEALSALPREERGDVVAYVQGRHAYFSEAYTDAIRHFEAIPGHSEYYARAQYFIGASYVATRQLPAAIEVLSELVEREPRGTTDARVRELAHMGLARIHYERDEPARALDHYVEVSRHSDRFDDVLYEAAWVYVQADQFDRALRALELLSLSDPTSARLPEVRILEGNLRIRAAQRLHDEGERGNSAEQYARATEIFESTKAAYESAHAALERAASEEADPLVHLGQIVGRSDGDATEEPLPAVAASWLRDEADVDTLVAVGRELSSVEDEIAEAEIAAERIDRALEGGVHAGVFPDLARERARAIESAERAVRVRAELANEERAIAGEGGPDAEELADLRERRRAIERELAHLPDADLPYRERRQRARERYDELDGDASRARSVLGEAESELRALETYLETEGMPDAEPEEVAEVRDRMAALERAIDEGRAELEALRREAVLARDRAGIEREREARALMRELRRTVEAEHELLAGAGAELSDDDLARFEAIGALHGRADEVLESLDAIDERASEMAATLARDIRDDLDRAIERLSEHKEELAAYEARAREAGARALASGMEAVLAAFEDILIRADVGIVDVAWSQKEEADEVERTLTLERARQLRALDGQFREVLELERAQAEDEASGPGAGEGGNRR